MNAAEKDFFVRPLSPAQKQAGRFLADSQSKAVPVTVFGDARVCGLMEFRERNYNRSTRPTLSPFLISALVKSLEKHQDLNAHYDDGSLRVFHNVHLGLAVATAKGDLLTPVLKNLCGQSLQQISAATDALVRKARAGELGLTDIRGASFTLSNLGQSETARYATPIVPLPQVAILATLSVRQVPVVSDQGIAAAHMLPLSLSFDHRALNGAAATAFLQTFSDFLKQPELLL